jgi:hypothetical protein
MRERRRTEREKIQSLIGQVVSSGAFYAKSDAQQLKGAVQRQQELARLIAEAERRWLELHAELEQIGDR